ncbi:MAG: hypothetical protein VW268_14155 [Rhodospirillaceae bacterium]
MTQDKKYHPPDVGHKASADQLHHHADVVHQRQVIEQQKQRAKAEHEAHHAYFEFMNREFTDEDIKQIEELTGDAVHRGDYEVEILRFPASYLVDKGRAINNAAEDWLASLTGFTKSLYDAYHEIGEPMGYRLTARALDYPNGMLGNVGSFLKW